MSLTDILVIVISGLSLVISVIVLIKLGKVTKSDDIVNTISPIKEELKNNSKQNRDYILENLPLKNQLIVQKNTEDIIKMLSAHNEKLIEKFSYLESKILSLLLKNAKDFNDKVTELSDNQRTNFNVFQEKVTKNFDKFQTILTEKFDKLETKVDERLEKIGNKVEEKLSKGFEDTNKTFISVIERLKKIDEAQKNIDKLSTNIISLQDVLTDKKTRGTFGEVQLTNILEAIFDKNDKIYRLQHQFPNGKMADAVMFLPDPVGQIAIDSKFPLENYKAMVDNNETELNRETAKKGFKADLKKHIDDIATKYIIKDVTTDQAMLFLPAEAIFAEVHAYHPDIVEYSQKKRVWLTSPTTLMATLSTVQIILKNLEREKHSKIIKEHLDKLSQEFSRYSDRWDKLAKHIDTVSKDVHDINVTSGKISKKFAEIHEVKFDDDNSIESVVEDKLLP